MKTIKHYHDLYLKCDVLLLDGASEKIRNSSLKNYLVMFESLFECIGM